MGKIASVGCIVLVALCLLSTPDSAAEEGTLSSPIIDSAMTTEEALVSVAPACPPEVLRNQEAVEFLYYSFDGKVHQGQLIIDRRLAEDIREIFRLAFVLKFPIHSAIPLAHRQFIREGTWSDELSMEANNTSGFNYRSVTGGGELSKHAFGYAVDINPLQNPYIKGSAVVPASARYEPEAAGTFTGEHPLVREFIKRGWTWGGSWHTLKDYMHFEKAP